MGLGLGRWHGNVLKQKERVKETGPLRAVLTYFTDDEGRKIRITVQDLVFELRHDGGMYVQLDRKLTKNCLERVDGFHLRANGEISAYLRRIPC